MKKNAPRISVIIPVYKVEKYLHGCLDSLQKQTFEDWEGIIVNDGSPDHSQEIAEEYVRKDSRFSLICKPNGGLSSARNAGLKKHSGDYVFFLDSDDLLHPETLKLLLETAEESGSDITACRGFQTVEPEKHLTDAMGEKKCTESSNPLIDVLTGKIAWVHYAAFRLYRSSTIKDMTFDEKMKSHEDMFWDVEALGHSRKIVFFPLPLYLYRINPNSLTQSMKPYVGMNSMYANCLKAQSFVKNGNLDQKYANLLCRRIMGEFWVYLKIVLMTGNAEEIRHAKQIFRSAKAYGWYDMYKSQMTLPTRITFPLCTYPFINRFLWLFWRKKYGR